MKEKEENRVEYVSPKLKVVTVSPRQVLCTSTGEMGADPYHFGDGEGV